ncbi:MAG: hypothetical protein ACOX6N_04525 [Patescibacteria group bacterium]|jgi:hypothetical protein
MKVEEFLKKVVEGYLFHDLANMAVLGPLPDCDDGAVGYPMVMTTLSGIELMGGLISPKEFKDNGMGDAYFLNYWNECLSGIDSKYNDLGYLFRNLVRHGLAHTYLTKHGIEIQKNFYRKPDSHGIVSISENHVKIDCVGFYKDLEKSYYMFIKPVVFNNSSKMAFTKTTMQSRLNEMIGLYQGKSDILFQNYKVKNSPKFYNSYFNEINVSASGIGGITHTTTLPFENENNK